MEHRIWTLTRRLCHGRLWLAPGCSGTLRGRDNEFCAERAWLENVAIDVVGDGNRIRLGEGAALRDLRIFVRGDGHTIEVGPRCRVSRRTEMWLEGETGQLTIGEGTTIESAHIAVTEKNTRIVLGRDCMLATDVEIRNGDSHEILDARSRTRINWPADVLIGEHVWIGARAMVLKGASISDGSVIAAGAIVTAPVGPHCVVAGNPARLIRENIEWSREWSVGR